MERAAVILISVLAFCCFQNVDGRVSYSLKLISFSNPDGTSWDQLRYHGNRRLCDSRSTDVCDTYIKICIQMRGKCFINHDSKVFPNSNNITFGNDTTWTGTTNNWDSNLLAMINPFDKDSPNKPGDLIDILNIPLSVWPGLKQECTGHQPIVMTNHTTLIMEFKAWCSPGYSGPGCTFRYTGSDPYLTCNNGSVNLQCSNEEPAIVRYSSYTPSSSTSIQSFEQHIGAFLKNHICDTLRLYSKQSLWSLSRVGFIAKCGDKPVDPIVVQAALGTEGYQNQGSLKIVPTPLNNYRQGMNVVAIFAVKIQSYTNQDRTCKTKGTRKCCDGGNLPHCDTDTCDTHFRSVSQVITCSTHISGSVSAS
ncbi:uncharacterized protein [Argopecten irradians]|uniref:uncharacterized protein n=1 Tax=Argopecten irradians TaxID=31199 RepID=UPI003719DCFC